ncbi:hypothetical protein GCK72_009962 [Caenorhabditis remanei]|uniref:Uncharacterized protein n=1 Tax=Caenorhabditis remanei TaxID=31234 RepID=A0A6A5H4C3_CAERE|nr:hypothetical protein GCK72_009962 [Caenorhabditis remanei]KAF1761706.1 hypothetical protein GCK72_009962 [Caenorhabditis remanei]
MKLFLLVLIFFVIGIVMGGNECRVDSECTQNKLCVYGDCLTSNHPSGRVVVTDRNYDEICVPPCPIGQECATGICVPGS